MSDTIFSKIIAGEVPSYKIYEDDRVLAFLDIAPKAKGHALVVPKKPVEYVWDLADDDYNYLMQIVKKIALHLRKTTGKEFVRMDIVGTDVPHAHIHLIPFNLGEGKIEDASLKLTEAEFQQIADQLKLD